MIFTLIAAATAMMDGGAGSCAGAASHYVVSVADANSFNVEARFDEPLSRLDLYAFSLPGRPEGQAEPIRDLAAHDSSGAPVAIGYVGEGGWEIGAGKRASRVSYRVVADHDAVDWSDGGPGKDEVATRFDGSFFFAGHAFFLIDYDAARCPAEVSFDLPDGWSVASPWPMRGQVATARDPGNLARNAFVMGAKKPSKARRGGVDIAWVTSSDLSEIEPQISAMMPRLIAAYSEFFGGAPVKKFTAVFFGDYMTDGGAFQDSFALRIATPLSKADRPIWSHTLGHETMHLWNGAAGISSREPQRTYWFTEGFTDYLTIKLMWRSNLIDEETLKRRLAGLLRRYEVGKAMARGVKLEDAGADKFQNWALIYGGGAVVAMLLDAELSAVDPGAFQKAMRDLFENRSEAYDLASLMARLDGSTGGKASETLGFINSAPSSAAMRRRLSAVGVEAAYFGFDETHVEFPDCGRENCLPAFLARK